jgi:cell division transport system permease protein
MSLGYIIKEGFAGYKRARLSFITSVMSLTLAVLLLGLLARFGYNTYEIAEHLRSQVDVEVYIHDVDYNRRLAIRQMLEEKVIVDQVNFISKDSASAVFIRDFGIEGSSLADLGFLPASYRVSLKSDAGLEEIAAMVEEIRLHRDVDEVVFNQLQYQMLQSRFRIVMLIGGGLGAFILLTAIILVFNTIRLTIYAKKKLIRAMKLVGATNSFIRRPFIVEGLLQGFIAGLMASLILDLVFRFLLPRLIPDAGGMSFDWPFGEWYLLISAMMILSLLMGLFGSRWAARKFIRETSIATNE